MLGVVMCNIIPICAAYTVMQIAHKLDQSLSTLGVHLVKSLKPLYWFEREDIMCRRLVCLVALLVFSSFYSLQCDTLSSRRKMMVQQPPPLAVLDGACSRVSEAIAEVSSIWNIPHVCSSHKTKCVSIVECTLQTPSWIPLAHLGIVHSLPL